MNTTPTPSPLASNPPPQRCGLAVTSLVLGIVSYALCLGPLAGIPGAICGHVAQSRIRKSGRTLSGDGLALAGIILGWTSLILVPIIGLLAAIAIPNFVKAREASQRAACVSNLHMIDVAKAQWAFEYKKGNEDAPSEQDLTGPGKYIREKLNCPAGGSYSLGTMSQPPTCTIPGHQIESPTSAPMQPSAPPVRRRPR